jgi:hypothetical protein
VGWDGMFWDVMGGEEGRRAWWERGRKFTERGAEESGADLACVLALLLARLFALCAYILACCLLACLRKLAMRLHACDCLHVVMRVCSQGWQPLVLLL